MIKRATADSWSTSPLPEQRARLPYQRRLSADAYQRLTYGLIPGGMEERWFAYWSDDVLHVHRSWTGTAVYEVRFKRTGEEYEVVEVWVNRDPEQYRGSDDLDLAFIDGFIDHLVGRSLPNGDLR